MFEHRSGRFFWNHFTRSVKSGSVTNTLGSMGSTAKSGMSPTKERTFSGMVWSRMRNTS